MREEVRNVLATAATCTSRRGIGGTVDAWAAGRTRYAAPGSDDRLGDHSPRAQTRRREKMRTRQRAVFLTGAAAGGWVPSPAGFSLSVRCVRGSIAPPPGARSCLRSLKRGTNARTHEPALTMHTRPYPHRYWLCLQTPLARSRGTGSSWRLCVVVLLLWTVAPRLRLSDEQRGGCAAQRWYVSPLSAASVAPLSCAARGGGRSLCRCRPPPKYNQRGVAAAAVPAVRLRRRGASAASATGRQCLYSVRHSNRQRTGKPPPACGATTVRGRHLHPQPNAGSQLSALQTRQSKLSIRRCTTPGAAVRHRPAAEPERGVRRVHPATLPSTPPPTDCYSPALPPGLPPRAGEGA